MVLEAGRSPKRRPDQVPQRDPVPARDRPESVDFAVIAGLLGASHAAHAQYRGSGKDRAMGLAFMRVAAVARRDAHQLDPEHTAPAWLDEQSKTPVGRDTHDELVKFYREKLG